MPSQVIALSELCLHDAEVIRREEITQASGPMFFPDDLPPPRARAGAGGWAQAGAGARAASGPTLPPHDPPFPYPLSVWSAIAVITLRVDEEILCLFYCLWDHIRIREAPENWQFSKLREHWLYDEVQIHGERWFTTYMHSILLSTGVVLDIPFTSVVIHRFPIPQMGVVAEKKTA
jgi:hypothetical protein